MDPNVVLHALIDAAVKGDGWGVLARSNDLAVWLNRGGFPPDDPREVKSNGE